MKCARFVVSLLTWFVMAIRAASGCSCGPPPPMCQRYHEIKVMFVGTPVETNDDQDGFIKAGVWYRFKVEEVFKGLQPDTKEVVVDPSSGTSCQTRFEVGKRYLITNYGDSIADQHTAAISIIRGLIQGGKPRPSGAGDCGGRLQRFEAY